MSEWISVTDRLPERVALHLVFDANKPQRGVWVESMLSSYWNGWLEHCNQPAPTITHWMPLPKPPALDSEEAK